MDRTCIGPRSLVLARYPAFRYQYAICATSRTRTITYTKKNAAVEGDAHAQREIVELWERKRASASVHAFGEGKVTERASASVKGAGVLAQISDADQEKKTN
jgi:hypothetical protein